MIKTEFYSYDAKYVDEDAVELLVPTNLSADELSRTLSTELEEPK